MAPITHRCNQYSQALDAFSYIGKCYKSTRDVCAAPVNTCNSNYSPKIQIPVQITMASICPYRSHSHLDWTRTEMDLEMEPVFWFQLLLYIHYTLLMTGDDMCYFLWNEYWHIQLLMFWTFPYPCHILWYTSMLAMSMFIIVIFMIPLYLFEFKLGSKRPL